MTEQLVQTSEKRWNGRSGRPLFRMRDWEVWSREAIMGEGRRQSPGPESSVGTRRADTEAAGLSVIYNQAGEIFVTGPVTGKRYAFGPAETALEVNRRDAEALLRSKLFRRA